MRRDHRPYLAKRLHRTLERGYVEHFLRPQLEALGPHSMIMQPWNLRVHGRDIRIGRAVHVVTGRDRPVRLTTWSHEGANGQIDIGDCVLLCPGVRIDSAVHVEIGTNCMLAAGTYVTDADWHDVYDRTRIIGSHAPVVLEDNVWLGDGAIVCKGVTIGRNTVIGAGSVVTRDMPANIIAAGNPAREVRKLDPDRAIVTRSALLADPEALDRRMEQLERTLLGNNRWAAWLRTLLRPGPAD